MRYILFKILTQTPYFDNNNTYSKKTQQFCIREDNIKIFFCKV